eukprot:4029743-Pleurochrysis_carterae.AAC.2
MPQDTVLVARTDAGRAPRAARADGWHELEAQTRADAGAQGTATLARADTRAMRARACVAVHGTAQSITTAGNTPVRGDAAKAPRDPDQPPPPYTPRARAAWAWGADALRALRARKARSTHGVRRGVRAGAVCARRWESGGVNHACQQ